MIFSNNINVVSSLKLGFKSHLFYCLLKCPITKIIKSLINATNSFDEHKLNHKIAFKKFKNSFFSYFFVKRSFRRLMVLILLKFEMIFMLNKVINGIFINLMMNSRFLQIKCGLLHSMSFGKSQHDW